MHYLHVGIRFTPFWCYPIPNFIPFWEKTHDVSSRFRRQNASLHTKIKVCTQECKLCTSQNEYQLCIETAGFCSFLMSISVIYSGIIGVVRRRDLTVLYFLCQQLSNRYFNPLKNCDFVLVFLLIALFLLETVTKCNRLIYGDKLSPYASK